MARSIQVDFIVPVFRNICYTEIRINVCFGIYGISAWMTKWRARTFQPQYLEKKND